MALSRISPSDTGEGLRRTTTSMSTPGAASETSRHCHDLGVGRHWNRAAEPVKPADSSRSCAPSGSRNVISTVRLRLPSNWKDVENESSERPGGKRSGVDIGELDTTERTRTRAKRANRGRRGCSRRGCSSRACQQVGEVEVAGLAECVREIGQRQISELACVARSAMVRSGIGPRDVRRRPRTTPRR